MNIAGTQTGERRAQLGIDGCKGGWVAFIKQEAIVEFWIFEQLTNLLNRQLPAATVFIDMPMGFPAAGEPYRQCDKLARQWLPGRAASVFPVPCKAAVYAPDYRTASLLNKQQLGKGIPIQTWNIVPKIRQLDNLLHQLRTGPQPLLHFYESHPELVFAGLAGRPMQHSKATAQGQAERLALLTALVAAADLAVLTQALSQTPRKVAKPDDIIDAFVLMYAASQRQHWQFLPSEPDLDATAISRQIVFVLT